MELFSYSRLVVLAMVSVLAGCGSDSPDPGDDPDTDPDEEPGESTMDAGKKPDGSVDARVADASGDARVDASVDAGAVDASVVDANTMDARVADAGADADAKVDAKVDANVDASASDAGSADATTTHTFKFDSKAVWGASGFTVAAGKCYEIETKIDDKWLDLDVPADLSGWIDKSDPRFVLFTPFRRVAQDDIGFYQFATCVDKDTDQCFPVGEKSTVCPKSAGELFFFINDASGFESNNVGTATVSIRAK